MAESETSPAIPYPSYGSSYQEGDTRFEFAESADYVVAKPRKKVCEEDPLRHQLLKKHGWKEGTGLGIYEQGRLEPVETHVKNNKRGVGAEKVKKKVVKQSQAGMSTQKHDEEEKLPKKRTKALSKKMRRMEELEKRLQEKEFERAFFREFWPDNV